MQWEQRKKPVPAKQELSKSAPARESDLSRTYDRMFNDAAKPSARVC